MKKILVIGCPGSGKSWFSRKLSELTGIPVYHLDNMFWNSDATNVDREVLDERIAEVMKKDRWIMDGHYLRTLKWRLENCDTVFFLDLPVEVCLEAICNRVGQKRSDIPWTEKEVDPEFYQYVREFPEKQLKTTKKLLEEAEGKNIIHLTSRQEVSDYLEALKNDN